MTGELTIAMPLSSSTEWAADAPADATKVSKENATSKEAPAAELQNTTRTPSRTRESSIGQEQNNENGHLDCGSASPRRRATSKAGVTSKEASALQTAEWRSAEGESSPAREARRERHKSDERYRLDRGSALPSRGAASKAAVASKEAVASREASSPADWGQQIGSRATAEREETASSTTGETAAEPVLVWPVFRVPPARETSRAACRAAGLQAATSSRTRDVRRRDQHRPYEGGMATARCALLACSLLVWVSTPRPGLRPHTGPGTRRKTRAGASRKSPHEHRRKPKVETSYGSRRKPKGEPFTSRNMGFVLLESQIASKIPVSYVWYTLNWHAMSQRLPWQTAGSGGEHA